ncbi:PTS-dependent dihydroxyacetone kinase phosphotransferase subunit DhaM [Staphylococcus taiwanensis]|nr:PTS-dependent dihydroxyacetone kinase phosphotransferase subunit DhaM [Staphylococcus taiwanensis]
MTSIVVISHSKEIADGTKALLSQMANNVNVIAYGGVNGDIGTSFDEIQKIINNLEEDALCFYDLGSSEMNIDLALDMYDGPYNVTKLNAPIVEGSFTAAVKLSVGGSIEDAVKEVEKSSYNSAAFD